MTNKFDALFEERNKFDDLMGQVPVRSAAPKPGTVAALIERFIHEMDGGVRPLGTSHRITLRALQQMEIGKKLAAAITKHDIIEFCKWRRLTVSAATAGGNVTALSCVLKYAGAAWTDCDALSDKAIKKAKPFLRQHGLTGKSTPRTRRPSKEEKERLEAYFAAQNDHKRTITDMVKVSRWQHASSRRIGESCALLWRDWTPEKQTILVRKMKDPKNRNKQKVVALPWDAQDLLYEWVFEMDAKPELRTDVPRILPFNSKTCSQRYTLAKKALQIENLHLHDDRRDRVSRLVEEDGHTLEEAIQYSGHDTIQVSSLGRG
jgi:integrase